MNEVLIIYCTRENQSLNIVTFANPRSKEDPLRVEGMKSFPNIHVDQVR